MIEVNLDDVTVRDNEAEERYEAGVKGHLAFIAYERAGDTITLIHTEVPKELEGHGIAGKLAQTALEDARARGLTVVPLCPYVQSYIRRHQEYLPLVDAKHRERLRRG